MWECSGQHSSRKLYLTSCKVIYLFIFCLFVLSHTFSHDFLPTFCHHETHHESMESVVCRTPSGLHGNCVTSAFTQKKLDMSSSEVLFNSAVGWILSSTFCWVLGTSSIDSTWGGFRGKAKTWLRLLLLSMCKGGLFFSRFISQTK